MDQNTLDEIIACLPRGRTLFHYHRDRYTLYLLEHLHAQGRLDTLADLKRSPFAGWLQKPLLKEAAASLGRANTPLPDLLRCASSGIATQPYILSLGQWGRMERHRYQQTSRPGPNLVLHLNLPHQHEDFIAATGVSTHRRLRYWGHPNNRERITLAWARIDLDFASGEALIEEVQSDWVRTMTRLFRRAHDALAEQRSSIYWSYRCRLNAEKLLEYEKILQQHNRVWSEAMLTAALWFIFEELGMRQVYYHSWETGTAIKRINTGAAPPRSLYSDLPERFAFQPCAHGPGFVEAHPKVARVRRKQVAWEWYRWAA